MSSLNQEFHIRPSLKLISLLGASFDYVIKVMKPLYGISEANNHWFATYHTYHKDKLGMTESTYDTYFLYNSGSFRIVEMQTDDILILINNDFASIEENVIKSANIMTKNRKYLTSANSLKLNSAQIKLGIILTKRSHVRGIFLVTGYVLDSTSSKRITRKNLLPKNQYLAPKAKSIYTASMY